MLEYTTGLTVKGVTIQPVAPFWPVFGSFQCFALLAQQINTSQYGLKYDITKFIFMHFIR